MWGRGDGPNDPRRNGEYWLLRRVLACTTGPRVLLDVGANRGDWTLEALQSAGSGVAPVVHAFEPSSATRRMLESRVRLHRSVQIHGFAMADREGEADFYSEREGGGTSSLSAISGGTRETVPVTTLDRFLEQAGIDQVAMAKIDAEGFDLPILRGAECALREGRIGVVQFEYNWRWILNRASLRDAFEWIEGKPYRLGKLVGEGLEFYPEWHPELDRYFENNFVLVRTNLTFLSGWSASFDAANAIRFDRGGR